MLNSKVKGLILAAGFLFTGNLMAQDAVKETAEKINIKVKEAYYTVVDKTTYTVDFKKGSSTVSKSAKNSLKALFTSLKGELAGGEIVVAGWSDKEFPLNPDTKLTSADTKLAADRIANVQKVIKDLGLETPIQTINLGEQNTLLGKLFSSTEQQVKDLIQQGETDSRKVAAITKTLKSDGGPQKAVVLVRRLVDQKSAEVVK